MIKPVRNYFYFVILFSLLIAGCSTSNIYGTYLSEDNDFITFNKNGTCTFDFNNGNLMRSGVYNIEGNKVTLIGQNSRAIFEKKGNTLLPIEENFDGIYLPSPFIKTNN